MSHGKIGIAVCEWVGDASSSDEVDFTPRISDRTRTQHLSRVGTNIFLPLFLSFGVPRSVQDKTRGLQLRIPQLDTGPATRKDEGLMSPETWLAVHLALGIVIGATLPRAREKGIPYCTEYTHSCPAQWTKINSGKRNDGTSTRDLARWWCRANSRYGKARI